MKSSVKKTISLVLILVLILSVFAGCSGNTQVNDPTTPMGGKNSIGKSVGDIITFGEFEQDNNADNGKEAIEWQIIDIKSGKALIISCSVLDCKEFNEQGKSDSWEDSLIREWLNSDFYESAFSLEEKKKIKLTKVENPGICEGYDSSGCWLISNDESKLETVIASSSNHKTTKDYVFLLNVDEINQYFSSNDEKKAFLSIYGSEKFIKLGLEQAKNNMDIDEKIIREYYEESAKKYGTGFCNWWLRSSGTVDGYATAVDFNGIAGQNIEIDKKDCGIRPAMWIGI